MNTVCIINKRNKLWGKEFCEIIKERMIGCDYELSTIVFDTSRWASPRVDEGKAGDARVSGHVDD